MISDLSTDARALADYMSALSEKTWFAGWMRDLEYMLWSVVNGEKSQGRLNLTGAQVAKLKSLSDACQGWIVFRGDTEETFVPSPEWIRLFTAWSSANNGGPGSPDP
ncbi:MAG: hypothetical protein ACLPTF_20395 [Steroidobacteraceae bacterium]